MTKEAVRKCLDELNIPYEWYEHEAAHTMEDCLALPYAAPDVTFCKNIFLCTRQRTSFYLYVTLPDKPFRTADVSKLLTVSRLSFAPEKDMQELCQLSSGSLSPLTLFNDPDDLIVLVLDRDIRRGKRIAFHPCDNTATVIFPTEVFTERVIPAMKHRPVWLDVPWPKAKEDGDNA
ncbi:MAG: prolyl-tRNA synthetase associated domain-containing protein [Clostridia bacterium]|nr:prolyl-tRNA synthetase associated domain-containing protein [Clostridia bacterium]